MKAFNELKNDFEIDKWLSKNNVKSDVNNDSHNTKSIEKTNKKSEKSIDKSLSRKKTNFTLPVPYKSNKNNLDKYLDFVMNENQVKKIYEDEDDLSSSDESA